MNSIKELKKGFTMIELLMSMALITIIAGLGIPVYQSFQVKNDLDIAANTWAQTIRRAQILSVAMDGDTSWGLIAQSSEIVLFKGASYAGRDTDFDESYNMPTSITPSGVTEIVFEKFTGLPDTTGSTTFTSSTNETRIITINAKGTLTY